MGIRGEAPNAPVWTRPRVGLIFLQNVRRSSAQRGEHLPFKVVFGKQRVISHAFICSFENCLWRAAFTPALAPACKELMTQ